MKRQQVSSPRPGAVEGPIGSWWFARLVGSGLLIATGAIHLDLYLTGYRTIPTIGWLFLTQVISDVLLATAVIVSPRRLFSAAGAGLCLSTLVGYLLALRISLFGFREVRTTAGVAAAVIEIVGFVTLAGFATRPDRRGPLQSSRTSPKESVVDRRRVIVDGQWLSGVIALLAAAALGVSLSLANAASTTCGASRTIVKVAQIHGHSVLTNARGYTLYWFAPDSSTTSHCYGTCAAYWPPVIGTASTGAGVAGTFATLRRSDGAEQVTYDGHPLYTYVGDSAPGQATGNRIDLNGGWWYEMKVSS